MSRAAPSTAARPSTYRPGTILTVTRRTTGYRFTVKVIRDDGARVRGYQWVDPLRRYHHEPATFPRDWCEPHNPDKSPSPTA